MFLISPFAAASCFGILLLVFLIRCLSSPLNKISGPVYAKFTSWPLKWHEFRAERTRHVHALHLQYGPVVRLAPNEVAFATTKAAKEIYGSGGSGYDKTEFYNLFRVYGRRTMFTTLNKENHIKRKRIIADRYANSNVMRQWSLSGICVRADKFVNKCRESIDSSLDLYVYLHSYAFDCVTHHLFHPRSTNSLEDPGDEKIMREAAFDNSLQSESRPIQVPLTLLYNAQESRPDRLLQYYSPTLHSVADHILRLINIKPRETPLADAYVLSSSAVNGPKTTDTPAIAPFTLLNRLRDEAHYPATIDDRDIAAECMDHMAAGIDTTGDALCFLMWELSQPRSQPFQRRLREELLDYGLTAPFDNLPYLDAVVHEGLRCFPAIPMSLPRYVPPGGKTIDGYAIPGGVIVSCQPYSMGRIDQSVFPDPDVFDPQRWLCGTGASPTAIADRKKLFFAFASGGRGCVGKHLALAEMKILLQKVYAAFETLPGEGMTEKEMAMSDQLISSRPAGERCLLRFVPVGKSTK